MAAVGELFWKLLENYYTFGWPFLLLHIGVLALSVWAWWGLHREIGHLNRWQPGSPSRGSQSTAILDQFIAESRGLGAQGVLVPITDFSDRLDSIAGGKVTELYERINLFLIVGIAGTLFGVFEFAVNAVDALGKDAAPERVALLGTILSSSLAKAFPVGFVGLALMFLGQVGASFSENRLNKAVAGAASRALKQRTGSVVAQAQIVENAAERIERAMKPLETLQEMMANSLKPVVEKLGERLDESLRLVKAQFSELQNTTDRFATAGKELGGSVETLGANIVKLDDLLAGAPKVLSGLVSMQAEQQKVMQVFQTDLQTSLQASRKAVGALEMTTGAAEKLPAQILTATREALQSVSLEVSATSAAMVAELKQRIAADYNHLFQRVEEQINLLNTSLRDTSDQLAAHLRSSAETLFTGAQKQAETLDDLIQKAEEHLQASLEASQGTISALDSMSRSAQELPAQLLETSRSALQEVAQAAVNTSNTMAEDLRTQINASSDLLFSKVDDQVQALRENLAATTDELLSRLSSKSDELFAGVKGQVEAVQKLVDHTTGQLQEINRAASAAVEGLQGLREEAKVSLESSFAGMSQESGRLWREMSGRFAGEAQREFATFLEAIRAGTAQVRDSLERSAKTWTDAAFNANTVVKEPIAEVLRSVGDEIQRGIRRLDDLLAQRYPEVVKDVGAFTRELQALLAQAEAVQKGLDRWAASVERSQEEMARARERFLENLSPAAPQVGGSPEMAALFEEKLDNQLVPVRSKLSEMDQALKELRRRRDPLAWLPSRGRRKAEEKPAQENLNRPPMPPRPPEKPRTFWARLRSLFQRR